MTKAKPVDRFAEKLAKFKGQRPITLPQNCKKYGIESFDRLQFEGLEVHYITTYRDPETGQHIKYEWQRPKELRDSPDDLLYSFIMNGRGKGVPEAILQVLREQLRKDILYEYLRETPETILYHEHVYYDFVNPDDLELQDNYSAEWRAKELQNHPEYGRNGENALKEILKEYSQYVDIDNENIAEQLGDQYIDFMDKPQQAIILTEKTKPQDLTDISGYLEGNRGGNITLLGVADKFGKQQNLAIEAYTFCHWCFTLGTFADLEPDQYEEAKAGGDLGINTDSYIRFRIPRNPEKCHWYLPDYEACLICGRKNTCKIYKTLTPSWEITLAHPRNAGSVTIKAVTVFNLNKGDIIAVKGIDMYENGARVRYCKELQVLDHEIAKLLGFTNEMLNNHIKMLPEKPQNIQITPSLSGQPSLPDLDVDADTKLFNLFTAICIETGSEEKLNQRLIEFFNSHPEVRESKNFELDDKGNLKPLDKEYNRHFRNFCDKTLTKNQAGGRLEHVKKSNPSRYIWRPKEK